MRQGVTGLLLIFFFLHEAGVAADISNSRDNRPGQNDIRIMVLEANLLRTGRGLPPLRVDPSLCRAADLHAHEMAELNFFSHRGPQPLFASTPGSRAFSQGYSWARIAENICAGYRSVSEAFNSFVYSGPHYRNLMNPELEDIGIGVAKSATNRIYWVMLLGRQSYFWR
jgi:uncharacterized protein YkwD